MYAHDQQRNNTEVIQQLQDIKVKKGYTLHELSKKLDIQITTIERWLKTKRINKVYALFVAEKLKRL